MLLQKKIEQMTDLIKRLKLCVRWFKRIEEGYVQEKEKLRFELEAAEVARSHYVWLRNLKSGIWTD